MNFLYKLDINKNVLEWGIDYDYDSGINYILIQQGRINGKKVHSSTPCAMTSPDIEIASKIRDKRKSGWKTLDELGVVASNNMEEQLLKLLPYEHKDLNNRHKPQKAVLFQEGKFKYPALIQPKLNGIRATLSWTKIITGKGLFAETIEKAVLTSKEGIVYHMPHITDILTEDFFKAFVNNEWIDITYDGELYKHGMKLNEIRKRVPYYNAHGTLSKASGNPQEISFWCFDLAIPNIIQQDRTIIHGNLLTDYPSVIEPAYSLSPIVALDAILVYDDKHSREVADEFIKMGYEGGILRDLDSYYGFGTKDKRMMKLKKWYFTKCTIVDVVYKNSSIVNDKERTYIAIVLKNDINNEIFECTPEGDEEDRLLLLTNRDNYIGKLAKVKFRERSGIAEVPFQAIVTEIEN